MNETAKSYSMRKSRGDFAKYLRGQGVDIGCGKDVLKVEDGTVRPWDIPDGDAQFMAGVNDREFDFVYSSHCLEHMRDVPETLRNWTRILKPNGFLYVVVPEYILYEKMTWPSMFNRDHKQSFSFLIKRHGVARPNHYHVDDDLKPLLSELGMQTLRVTIEDAGFNYNAATFDQTARDALSQLCIVAQKKPK